MIKQLLIWTLIFIQTLVFAQTEQSKLEVYFKFGGYAKADFLFSQYNNGSVAVGSPLQDIHLPSAIPIGNGIQTYDTYFHVKESRFNFDVGSTIKNKPIRVFMELDFLLSKAGDEKISNSYNPRLREFYIEFDKIIIGQTWSNFMILIIPEDLDFAGAAEGIVFNRQPQVRITFGTWQFSLENPESFLTPYQGGTPMVSSGGFPDITARKNFKGDWGTVSIAGIGRGVRIYDAQGDRHLSTAYGITVGGKIKIGKRDDLRLMYTAGYGLGRYIAIGFIPAGTLDATNKIDLVSSMNYYVSYLHHWGDHWMSSVNISVLESDRDTALSGIDVNKSAWSASGNLIYNVTPELYFGGEVMYGYRDQESGVNGSFTRVQLSAKYKFNFRTVMYK